MLDTLDTLDTLDSLDRSDDSDDGNLTNDTNDLLAERPGPPLEDDGLSSADSEPLKEIDRFLEAVGRRDARLGEDTMSKYIYMLDDLRNDAATFKAAPCRNIFQEKYDAQNECEFSSPMKNVRSEKESVKLIKDASTETDNLAYLTPAKSIVSNLEEEKSRRQHCETVIRKLQKKLLEGRQRLAVARDVDSAKDSVISKLKEACAAAAERRRAAENSLDLHRNRANAAIKKLSEQNEKAVEELNKKEKSIETLKTLARETVAIKSSSTEKDNRILELKESNGFIAQVNKQLSENLAKTNAEKTKLLEELNREKNVSESLQNEICQLKLEGSDLSQKLKEQKSQNLRLEDQKSALQGANIEANNKIKSMESEFESFKCKAEAQKNDLKSHYQKQVDGIVSNKVAEFQNEMEHAVSSLKGEMQNKEKEMSVQFARHLYKVEQLHQHDLRIAEVKYEERLRDYKVQLDKANRKIQQLEDKLASIKNKRGEIAAQLHNVMENQWHQALKIITNDPNDFQSTVESENNPVKNIRDPSTSSSNECLKINDRNGEPPENQYQINNEHVFHSTGACSQNYFKVFPQKSTERKEQSDLYKNKLDERNQIVNTNRKSLIEPLSPSNKLIEIGEKKFEKSSRLKNPWK